MPSKKPTTPQSYAREWYDMMVRIWTDRIAMMGAVSTGALLRSVSGAGFSARAADDMQLTFRFLEYGLYVDAGTGRGYTRGNGGDLEILSRSYRYEHKLGRQRERRPWFSRSWEISREVLKDHLAQIMGDEFKGAFDVLEKI